MKCIPLDLPLSVYAGDTWRSLGKVQIIWVNISSCQTLQIFQLFQRIFSKHLMELSSTTNDGNRYIVIYKGKRLPIKNIIKGKRDNLEILRRYLIKAKQLI